MISRPPGLSPAKRVTLAAPSGFSSAIRSTGSPAKTLAARLASRMEPSGRSTIRTAGKLSHKRSRASMWRGAGRRGAWHRLAGRGRGWGGVDPGGGLGLSGGNRGRGGEGGKNFRFARGIQREAGGAALERSPPNRRGAGGGHRPRGKRGIQRLHTVQGVQPRLPRVVSQ